MEDKKTFGAYVLRRRKELGMTQRAFAEKLFVTESAVSKWERGLSYPDITMLGSICELLGVTEHELLTGSEDTRARRAEKLAERYLRLARRWRWGLGLVHAFALLGFLTGALCAGEAAIFYIALPATLMSASLTLAPALAADHPVLDSCRASLALGGFTVSLELLLLACWFASGGSWLAPAMTGALFGLGFVVAPVLLRQLPLPEPLRGCKLSLYLLIQTALLLLLLLACALTYRGDWFPVAALGVLFGLGFVVLPVLLRQLPLPAPLRRHKLLIYFSVQTLLLALLMCAVELPAGHARQLLRIDLPTAGLLLALPWGVMSLARYLPVSGWFRGAACCALCAIWLWRTPFALDLLNRLYTGGIPMERNRWFVEFNLLEWTPFTITQNVTALLIFAFAAAAIGLAIVGFKRRRR